MSTTASDGSATNKTTRRNVAIFGVGRIGRVHLQIVHTLLGHNLIAIGDVNAKCVAETVELLKLAPSVRLYDDAERMALDAVGEERLFSLDCVVIASNTDRHDIDAAPFLKHLPDVALYVEKPLSTGLVDGFEFAKRFANQQNRVMIGLQRRSDPALRYTKEIIDSGVLGSIREFRSVLRDQFPPPETYASRGLILDMGVHITDEAIWLLDEFPTKVWAKQFDAIDYESGVKEGGNTAHCGFLTPKGVIGRLDMSRTHASGYVNETHVMGTKATLTCGCFQGYPGPIQVEVWGADGQRVTALCKTFEMTTEFPGPIRRAEFQPRMQKAFVCAFEHFFACVDAKMPFCVSTRDVMDAQVFTEAAHRSAQNGGKEYTVERALGDPDAYVAVCQKNGLI